MTRTEMFDYIRNNKLQDEVQKLFGKNFTNVKSVLLADYIETNKAAIKLKNASKETTTKTAPVATGDKCVLEYIKLKNKYDSLVEAVATMLCSIDNEEASHDLHDAINNITASLAND